MVLHSSQCPVCKGHLITGLQVWHTLCRACGYEGSTLTPEINAQPAHAFIDEGAREKGLKALRSENFKTLLRHIKVHKPYGGRLLEIGCAHGWFIEQAQSDFTVLGIEPDQGMFDACRAKGLPVSQGYFPGDLDPGERFDIIVFNDVFEHIPDVAALLHACHQHLNENGLLVINLPSSDGFFYRMSKLLVRGLSVRPFERMWQKGLPSPHVHYFNRHHLRKLVSEYGFGVKSEGTLNSLSRQGLYDRISFAKGASRLSRLFIYVSLSLALPLIKFLPSDIIYSISQRK